MTHRIRLLAHRASLLVFAALALVVGTGLRVAPASYTAAQTDAIVVSVATGERLELDSFQMTSSRDTTVNVSFQLECDEGTDVNIYKASGIAPGSGVFLIQDPANPIFICGDGDDLLLTLSVPTTGAVDLSVNYQLLPPA